MLVGTMRRPEATTAEAELPNLFTAAMLQWLQERGCDGIYLIDASGDSDVPSWLEVTAPSVHLDKVHGWAFRFRDRDGGLLNVLFSFARADDLAADQVEQIAGYLNAVAPFTLIGTEASPRSGAVLVPRAILDKYIHDLRNRLGSLLMNAHVLCSRLPEQARSSRFAENIDQDGQACAEQLRRLSDVVLPSQSRGWG